MVSLMDLGIAGKRALVAASTSGLGLATAVALGEAGCQVVVSGRDPDRLAEAATQVANAHPMTSDVSTVAGAQQFMTDARAALGGVDILVTNAGGPPAGNFASTPLDAYPAALEQNLLAMAALCHDAVPSMQDQQWGRIVAITSASVRQPMANLILSNTARTGLTAFLKTLALEVAGDGITVNSVQPGVHLTPRLGDVYGSEGGLEELASTLPTKKIGDPADFGQVTAFLCSEPANYITGAALGVDGGSFVGLQ